MTKSEKLRNIIAQGWTMMFIVFLANLLVDLIKIAVAGDITKWGEHLGMVGVQFLLVIMSIYVFMPILVRTLSAQWFRYAVIAMTVVMTLFVAAHEISHITAQSKPFGIFHALDISHHVLGIWVIIAAILWAREPIEQTP